MIQSLIPKMPSSKNTCLVLLCFLMAGSKVLSEETNPTGHPVRPSQKSQIDKDELLGHIQYLASPELRGRDAGTPDQLKAAAYIADEFLRYGLEPFGDVPPVTAEAPPQTAQSGFFQNFSLSESKGAGAGSKLVLNVGGKDKVFLLHQDFVPLPAGVPSASAQAGVVFAGYGIIAPEIPYDDFSTVDLKRKWVLILRYQPQENDAKGKFGGKNYTRHAGLAVKILNCVMRHAAGVLIVAGPAGHENEPEKLDRGTGPLLGEFTLPVLQITRAVADQILAPSGKTIAALQSAIDADLSAQSFVINDARVEGIAKLNMDRKITSNVIAKLSGRDEKLKGEYVIVGAHCDHVGMGYHDSLWGKEGRGKIHPGADDNASGTAGLLEIAQYYGSLKPEERPRRSILFMAFSGEEEGLLGSLFYLNHPEAPVSNTVAMLNMDMIGRSANGGVQVAGIGTGKGFKDLVTKYGKDSGLKVYLGSSGNGPSDHASFTERKIPVLFFSTGLHPDYHRPTDTWDKINAPVAAEVAELTSKILFDLADNPARPEFTDGSARGFLGISPDMRQLKNKGYPVGQVIAGSPAAEAGLKPGDVITGLNGQELTTAMDLLMSLIDFGPGDPLDLSVMRGEDKFELEVKLTGRKIGTRIE